MSQLPSEPVRTDTNGGGQGITTRRRQGLYGNGFANLAITGDGKTAFVANYGSDSVSTIDVETRTKHPTDIAVGAKPIRVAITPCHR